MAEHWLAQASELARRREPFALATVVRCERPASAKPGAKALIRADGTLSGWGENPDGQLGDNRSWAQAPVAIGEY